MFNDKSGDWLKKLWQSKYRKFTLLKKFYLDFVSLPYHTYSRSLIWLGIDADLSTDQIRLFIHSGQTKMLLGKHVIQLEADFRIKTNSVVLYSEIDLLLARPPEYRDSFRMGIAQ